MKPPPFAYYAPPSTQAALALLAQHGSDARLLAGGQSLMQALNLRLVRPKVLIDLNRVPELAYVRAEPSSLIIGAMTRQRVLEEPEVAHRIPLLSAAAAWIGHFQTRNRGTVGGSLAQADPAGELPAVALLLGAELVIVGPKGRRRIAAEAFFQSAGRTALDATEMLVEVCFPTPPPHTGWSVQEMTQRSQAGVALAGALALFTPDDRGSCADARLVIFGIADRSLRLHGVEAALRGAAFDELRITAAIAEATAQLVSFSDVHASARYRREVVGELARRAIREAVARSGARPSQDSVPC